MEWYNLSKEEVLKKLNTSLNGLSEKEVEKRVEEHGYNIIKKEKESVFKIFLKQFSSPLIIVLLISSLLSVVLKELLDAIFIMAVVLINSMIGFFQEYKSEKIIEKLLKLASPKVKVIRNGKIKEISSLYLVPGDIVILEKGDVCSADCYLIESKNLVVNESIITGESMPVVKKVGKIKGKADFYEIYNMVFSGTQIVNGKGKGIVVATGENTTLGKMSKKIKRIKKELILNKKLNHILKTISFFLTIIIFLIFLIGFIEKRSIFSLILLSISMAVSSIPEGLPVSITLALALSAERLIKKKVIVKSLSSIEGLGNVNVIATDKTGTLTKNELVVRKILTYNKTYEVQGKGYSVEGKILLNKKEVKNFSKEFKYISLISFVNNDSEIKKDPITGTYYCEGDPTEGALKVFALKSRVNFNFTLLKKESFNQKLLGRKSVVLINNKKFSLISGAPEVLVRKCKNFMINDKVKEMNEEIKQDWEKKIKEEMSKGYRVIGFALNDVFLGIACLQDQIREGVKEAVKKCYDAGIRIIMITGDSLETAIAIAKEAGIKVINPVIGKVVRKLSDDELEFLVKRATIFARMSGEDKYRVIKALKKNYKIAVTGDGLNDALSLKEANVGIALGRGNEVAKEASDMILSNDNFVTIVDAVEEGRNVINNIKKFVRYTLAVNFEELFFILIAFFLNWPIPLLPLQVLWINMVTDTLPTLPLSLERENVMKKKFDTDLIKGSWKFIALSFFIALLGEILLFLEFPLNTARTVVVTQMIMFELVLVFNCRYNDKGALEQNPLENKYLFVGVIIALILQLIAIYTPLSTVLKLVPIGIKEWTYILGMSFLAILISPKYLVNL